MPKLDCNDYDKACADMVRVAYLSSVGQDLKSLNHREAIDLCLAVATYAKTKQRLSRHKAYALWFQSLTACNWLKQSGNAAKKAAETLDAIKALRPAI